MSPSHWNQVPIKLNHTPSITPTAKYCIFYLNLFFELKDKFSCSLPLALGLKHTLLIRENPLRRFRCWRLFICWFFCHLFQEHIITWVWIAQNAVGVFGFAESLFKSRKKKTTPKKKAFPQIQVAKLIPQLVLRTNPTSACLKPTSTPHVKVGTCPYLLYDILSRAEAWSFDHGAWLLWGDIMYLNKETVILRADGCFFLCFLKDISLI